MNLQTAQPKNGKQDKHRKNQRADKRFCVRLDIGTTEDGRRLRKSFYSTISKTDAERKMNEWIKEQTQPTRQNITMSEWAEEWFNTYTRNLAVATRRNKKSQLDIFCRFHHYGDRPLASFRPIDLQRFLNSLEGKTHTTMTVIKATIKSVFTSAFSNRIIEPFDLSGLTIPKGEDGTHRAITEDERSILISTWQGHPMGKYAMGYLFTGARRNELLAIQWEDIDMVHDTIFINKAYNQYTGGFVSTKTKSGNRTIP